MGRIKFAGFFLFLAVVFPIKMGMDGNLEERSDYIALVVVEVVFFVIPIVVLFISGIRSVNRAALVIKTAKKKIEMEGYIEVAEISKETRLKDMKVRKILNSAKRRGALQSNVEIR